jgi:3-methylornithyl-N6-L-lysine dehydrogenase
MNERWLVTHEKKKITRDIILTRLRTEDVQRIPQALAAYDQQLISKTGSTLKGIACHALSLPGTPFTEIVTSSKVCVLPMTCGQGVIGCFCDAVSSIIDHLGFSSFVARQSDAAGMAEAFEKKADIIVLADDDRFVAINVHTRYVSDNAEMAARGFVAGLDLMGNGLTGKNVLVIGCGDVGCHTARTLVTMGVRVSVYDIDPHRAQALQREISDEMIVTIQMDNTWHASPGKYPYIIDATPSTDVIDAALITRDTTIAIPGVPCGLSPDARKQLSHRCLHDPLQIGVATMVIDAANHRDKACP